MVERQRLGHALITVGKLLLWIDFLLLVYVSIGLRGGSQLWLWWVIAEGVTGLLLIEIGMHRLGSLTR